MHTHRGNVYSFSSNDESMEEIQKYVSKKKKNIQTHKHNKSGKSFVISLVSQWVELLLRKEGNNPDCPHIIRTSFTGSAASAIEGQTLHSSFALNFSGASDSLDDKKRDKMRHILKNLRVVILDEFR